MVKKDYYRFEQESAFGVIASASNVVWLPPTAASSSGGRALVGALENAAVWDLKTGERLARIAEEGSSSTAATEVLEVTCVANYNGQLFATGYSTGVIKVWDAVTGTLQVSFNAHRKAVTVLQFDATGTRLASGSKDTNVILWDLVNEVGLYRLRSHRDQVVGLEFVRGKSRVVVEKEDGEEAEEDAEAEDETWLLTASKDGTLKLWDLETQHCVETRMAHSTNDCWSMAYSPALGVVVTGSSGKELAFWRLDVGSGATMGRQLERLGTVNKQSGERAHTLKFFNGASAEEEPRYFGVASADRSVEIFRIKTADEIKKSVARKLKRRRERGLDVDGPDAEFQLSEDDVGEKYMSHTVVRTGAKVRAFDFAYQESQMWLYDATVGSAAGARDVRPPANTLVLLVALANNELETYSVVAPMSKHATVKKSAGPAEYSRLYSVARAGHRADIRALSVSSDDRMIASASNGQLKVWNARTQQCIRTFECGYALCCSFLPGDGLIVVGTKTGELELYDVASSAQLETVAAHPGGTVWSLHVGADGKTFATAGGADKTVKFWELRVVREQVPGTARTVARMRFKHTRTLELDDDVMAVRLSPDMRVVACALLNSTVKVFFADSLKFALDLYGHKLPVLGMDISADSKLLITCSADKNIKIWGLDFGDCHRSIFAHQESVMNVAFDPLDDIAAGGDTGYDDDDDFGGEEEKKGHAAHNFFSVAKDRLLKSWDGDNFQQLQALSGHHGEVWALAVAHSGAYVVTGSHDRSIRVWRRTDEQLFLSEERDRELEAMYEATLTAQYDEDAEDALRGQKPLGPDMLGEEKQDDEEEESSAGRAGKTTIETLKAGERLIEALEIGVADRELHRRHAEETRAAAASGGEAPALGARHIILVHKQLSAEDYVLRIVAAIKPQELEDAVLVLPFDKVLALFDFVALWVAPQSGASTSKAPATRNRTAVVCRVLFTALRVYHRQIIANQAMRATLATVRAGLRARLAAQQSRVAYNVAGLRVLQQTWDRAHRKQFVDEREQQAADERAARKRIYTTV